MIEIHIHRTPDFVRDEFLLRGASLPRYATVWVDARALTIEARACLVKLYPSMVRHLSGFWPLAPRLSLQVNLPSGLPIHYSNEPAAKIVSDAIVAKAKLLATKKSFWRWL